MREIVLGTAGHVDHGKTSLVKALTGINTDRLKEEKKRGITIELGFAFLDLPCGHRLGIIDVPGHERFVKNMVAGAAGIDLVAFVIAADEGIMPQTREHFEICRLLGVKSGLVVITKKDMVEPEWLELVKEEVREFLADSFLAEAPMVPVSSITGEGIDQVRQVLDKLVAASDFIEAYGPFRLPIDRIFSMKGFGAVVTGTSISGRIGVGDDVILYPKGTTAKIRGIQVHNRDVQEVEEGYRTAINIQGIEKVSIERGAVLASAGCLAPSYMLDADFQYLSGNKKPLKNRTRVRVHIGTAEIMGRIVLLEDEELPPGGEANVQLLLEEPVGAWPGDRYVVRSYSPVYTIGGGGLFNVAPVKKRRFRKENAGIFDLYRHGTIQDKVLFLLKEMGWQGLTFDQLSVKTGQFGKRFQKLLSAPISARKILVIDSDRQWYIESGVYDDLKSRIEGLIADFHAKQPMKPGIPKEELRSRLSSGMNPKLFAHVLNDLQKNDRIALEESTIRLASHEVSLAEDADSLRRDMRQLYVESGLQTPTLKEVYARFAKYSQALIREVLEVLIQDKLVLKISEDLYFPAAAVDTLHSDIVEYLQKNGEIDAQGFKSMTGLSRKFSIPLLEYFDKRKITLRVGDKRVLRERRA